jgi:hypothetical protein
VVNYKKSKVLSVRFEESVLDGVRARAEEHGRSVSGEVVFLVREQLDEHRMRSERKRRPITGWLSQRGLDPLEAKDFAKARAEVRRKVDQSIQTKAKRS